MNIRLAPIGDFVEPVRTWNPATTPDSTFNYVDLSAVDQIEKQIKFAVPVRCSEAPSRARQLISSGDILVSTVRPNLNGVAPVTDAFDGATASTGFCVLRPRSERLSSNYLMHWVRSPQFIDHMIREATGASYPAVSDRIIKASHIPLLPLDEQRRIAAILDKADTLCRKRKRSLGLIDSLTQSTFLRFAKTAIRTESRLCDFAKVLGGKRLPKGHDYCEQETGYKYLRVTDIQKDDLRRQDLKNLKPESFKAISRYVVDEGDIVITIAGTIGATRYIDFELAGVNLTENAAKIVLHDKERVDPIYLTHALQSEEVQKQIRASTGQVTIGKLALFRIETLEVPLPGIDEQRRFSRYVTEILISPSAFESWSVILSPDLACATSCAETSQCAQRFPASSRN